MQKTKINAVIPVYNAEKYIETTIKCLQNQSMQEFIAVFVNDGSTDSTSDILNLYQKIDNRFIVLNQENKGPGAARNFGLEYAYKLDSDYTIILDADDIYAATMFEDMVNKAEQTQADIVICRGEEYDDKSAEILAMPYSLILDLLPDKTDVFSYKDVKNYIFNFCVGWSWDKLYRTDFIKNTNLRFQELRNTDDAFFVYTSLVKAEKITYINKVLVSHRVNVSTSVSNSRGKDITCFYQAIIAIKNELLRMGIYDDLEKGFLNWALNFCIWNIRTSNDEDKRNVYNYLKEICFEELGVQNHRRSWYTFDPRDYDEYKRIMNSTYEQYLLGNSAYQKDNALKKVFRNLKRIGFKKTLKKIRCEIDK